MNAKLAQQIAESAHEVIERDVLVTDREGIIVGSNDRQRVGSPHAPSFTVIRRKEAVATSEEEAGTMPGVKPGYTAPICISGQPIGTISIAGQPQEVARYGLLVRKQAEIMLQEQILWEISVRKEQALRDLAESILLFNEREGEPEGILIRAQALGYRPEWWRIAFLVETGNISNESQHLVLQQIRTCFGPEALVAGLRNTRIVAFVPLGQQGQDIPAAVLRDICSRLVEATGNRRMQCAIGVGSDAAAAAVGPESLSVSRIAGLARSAAKAQAALSVGMALHEDGSLPERRFYLADDLRTEILLSSIPGKRAHEYLRDILPSGNAADLDGELARTFAAWCDHPFAPGEVARRLSIHRNTLHYRLKRIKEITGLDPWNFRDAFTLWSALMLRRFEQK